MIHKYTLFAPSKLDLTKIKQIVDTTAFSQFVSLCQHPIQKKLKENAADAIKKIDENCRTMQDMYYTSEVQTLFFNALLKA